MIEIPPRLGKQTCFELAKVVSRYALLPHPDVVAQFSGAVFPTRRVRNGDLTKRYSPSLCGNLVVDDNVSPRWALLWAHGYKRQTVASGWQVAHVWEVADDPNAFTHLANLSFVPKPLTRLTDAGGPAEPYLKFHAFQIFGWQPEGCRPPEQPQGYERLKWSYLPYCEDAKASLTRGASSDHALMRSIRQIGWTA